jgi:hypothetical protein
MKWWQVGAVALGSAMVTGPVSAQSTAVGNGAAEALPPQSSCITGLYDKRTDTESFAPEGWGNDLQAFNGRPPTLLLVGDRLHRVTPPFEILRAFSLFLCSGEGACRGVFIGENAHRVPSLCIHLQRKCSSVRVDYPEPKP